MGVVDNVGGISKVIKTINANKELIKVTIKENNNIYIFTNMNDIKVNKFAEMDDERTDSDENSIDGEEKSVQGDTGREIDYE